MTKEYFVKRKEIIDMLYNEYKKVNLNGGNLFIEGDYLIGIRSKNNNIDDSKTTEFMIFIENKIKIMNKEKYPDYLNCKCYKNFINNQWVRKVIKTIGDPDCSCVLCLGLLKEPFLDSITNCESGYTRYAFPLGKLIDYYTNFIIYKEKLQIILNKDNTNKKQEDKIIEEKLFIHNSNSLDKQIYRPIIDKQQKQIDELLKTQELTNAKHNEMVNKLLDRIIELSGKN